MIGIICAMSIEIDGFKEKMTDTKTVKKACIDYTSGKLCGKDVVLAECGIGKVNAAMSTQIMIDLFSPDVIINSGVGGALTDKTHIGDIVISQDVVQHDMNTTALGDKRGTLFFDGKSTFCIPADKDTVKKLFSACEKIDNTVVCTGTIASGDLFVSDRKKREKIANEFTALACEMEGAAVAQVCYRNSVPFAILRCISDDMDENQSMEYEKFKFLAADKSIEAVVNYLTT